MKLFSFASALALLGLASAFELKISDQDDYRQACSGMWGGDITYDPASRGQVAMVIYEWRDARYLGIDTEPDNYLVPKTYVCTTDAVRAKLCPEAQLGKFILNLKGASLEEISIWSASVGFISSNSTGSSNSTAPASGNSTVGASGFWNNPAGNPTPPSSEWDSPWRRGLALSPIARHVNNTIVPTGVLWYKEPILYQVDKKGYYCVAAIPITTGATADTAVHASFTGQVLFHNVFHGKLAATDYPKINFYMVLALVYLILGGVWGFLCFRHRDDLLPLQYYISYLVGFLVIEMTATWAYYRYLNSHHRGTATTMFLAVVAILDAGRNALSFFLLLVVSLGLSVVRESLGPAMTRVKLLAGAHFVFGVLYAMGMVELELESASALLLLMFVIPLSFTLSGFLLWIMYALNGTMAELADRKQTYKLSMFRTLYRILLCAVIVIGAFFVVSSMSFSNRLDEGKFFHYAPETWETRWYLLDAWLAILYLVVFTSIAFLWRPTGNNRRLAMSEELAQDEDAAGEYDLESMRPGGLGGPSEENLAGGNGARAPLRHEDVVFEIGDEDDDDDGAGRRRGGAGEREGLMGDGRVKDRND
ncbi:Lung seven transmembrane receptor, partial [Rhizoctonia solani]